MRIIVLIGPSKTRMNQGFLRWVGIVAVAVAVGTAPVVAEAGPSSDNLLQLAAKDGPSVGFGFGVAPLHWELLALPEAIPGSTATESRLLWDREARGKAVSFDITLKWPTEKLPIEPYVFIGPALLVDQPQELSNPTAVPADSVFRLGAKAGAGFTWRLTKEATLFGSYDVTTSAVDGLTSAGAKAPGTSTPTGYDLLYGVRFRY
jgi:hypothetical protein